MTTGANVRRVFLIVLALIGCGFLCWQIFRHRPADLTVYLAGAQALLDGKPVYESVAIPSGTLILPFTYPPFAAVVMIPFALLPFPATLLIWALLSLASLAGIAYLTAARLPFLAGITRSPWPTWQLALGIFVISAFSEPIIQNFDLGQVNLMIVVAVLYDTVSRTRYAGFATGIAAGFKVTPGLFMIFMLVTKRWADFGRAVLGFAVTLVIGSFFGLGQVWQYWTVELFATDRVGNPRRYSNLGISGVLQRSLSSNTATAIWIGCAAVLIVAVLWMAAIWWTRSKLISATLVGMATVLVSPISWPHHWVWLVPGVACAIALAIRAFRQGEGKVGWLLAIGATVTGIPALIQLRFHILEIMLAANAPGISFVSALYAAGGVLLVVALGVGARLITRDEGTSDDLPPADNATGVAAGA